MASLATPRTGSPPTGAARTAPGSGRLLRLLGTPAALLATLGALYLYVGAQDLDLIERRSLNAEYLLSRGLQHLTLTAIVVVLILAVAIPLGILLTRPGARRFAGPFLALANIGQATPTIGLIVLFGVAFVTWNVQTIVIVAVWLYGILPVLRNTMVGLDQVDRSVVESARGMGMSRARVLAGVELPLAVPVMLAGIRTALVITVGTVALATFVGAGGLGDVISNGIASSRDTVLLTGSVLVAVLALLVDWVAGLAEDTLRPRGV